MKLTESAVKHPVTTTMLFAAMLLMGLISLSRLGLELFPDITFPMVGILLMVMPGLSAFTRKRLTPSSVLAATISLFAMLASRTNIFLPFKV